MEQTLDFNDSSNFTQESVWKQKLKTFFASARYLLIQIWPSVNKVINFFIYHTIRLLKGFVKIALQEIGLKKD